MTCGDCGNTQPALPGFPKHVLCNYYHLHISNIADASRCEHFKPKVTTNADRIRAMTDEEMADFVFYNPFMTRQDALDWLKQEAEEGK